MFSKLLILTIVALTATTSFAQSGPSGPSGPSDDFKACDDNSTPTCPDGTALDLTTKHKPCTDGKPVCADGTIARPPPHHGPGHKGFGNFTACDDNSTPTCPDGTPLDLTTKHKPCTDGKPVCAGGTIARKPPHRGPGGRKNKDRGGKNKDRGEQQFGPPPPPCDDDSRPTCSDGSPPRHGPHACKDGQPPMCADGTIARKPPQQKFESGFESGRGKEAAIAVGGFLLGMVVMFFSQCCCCKSKTSQVDGVAVATSQRCFSGYGAPIMVVPYVPPTTGSPTMTSSNYVEKV